MSPEEFERLKEQEKAHLRKLKELKGQVREAERRRRLSQTLGDIAGAVEPDATYDEMLDRLSRETAQNEARFEIAHEAAQQQAGSGDADAIEERTREQAAEAERQEAELQKARARALVEQMKAQMGGPALTAPPPTDTPKTLGRTDAPSEPEDSDPSPPPADKTLGRRA